MPQPDHISKLGVPDPSSLDEDLQAIWRKCVEKLGFVPNVYSTYSLKPQRLRNFMAMYNEIMLSPSGLSKLEREMVAVVVSSANRCYYCLVAHGAAVRQLSGDPELGEMMALNYRVAKLDARQRAMLDFAWKMTTTPWLVDDADRDALRAEGLSEQDLFDLAETVAFFNLSNRMASATDMMPNREYHGVTRPKG
ncbi:MAG: alkylhydroperoxidase [Rhodospirillales bacterium 69-11]|nr:peroxidase-related enzyme [Rhodospirillales bacterium]MBN8930235.1 peroxidase-related enzyme [Rhodospirillales bacterium]OJW25592.1 MAG: alkylhydroperoxidase [Rhodospirillales bacterium 69-11]